jgi:signal transduction histidine kinase
MTQKSLIKLIFWILPIILIIPGKCCFSQNISEPNSDSKPDLARVAVVDSLNKLAFSVFRSNPTKTRVLARQSLELAQAINYKSGEGKAYNYIGMTFHMSGEYDSASVYYHKSLEIFEPLKDTLYLGKVLNNLSFMYSDQEYFNLALDCNFKSLKIAESLNDTSSLVSTYNNIGISYQGLNRFDQSMKYFRKMLFLLNSTKTKNENYYSAIANIGLIHIYQNSFDSAAICLNEVLEYSKKANDNFGMEQTYNFLGLLYAKTGKPNAAIRSFSESDKYATILEDKKMLAINGYAIAELNYQTGNNSEAKLQFENLLNLARQNKFLKIEMDSYFYLSKIDSINQNISDSYEKHKAGTALRDSLNSISVQKRVAELDIQYETLQKDQDISFLRHNKEIQDLVLRKHLVQRNFLFILLLVVVCFVGFIFYSRRKIRIANTLLAKQNEEIAAKNVILLQHEEQLERMVDERTVELLAAKEKAEQSDRLKSAFLANMSHEIRTPLNGILGFMELLQDKGISPAEQEKFFTNIRKSSDRLMNTINNIIELSKIESGESEVVLSDFDISERIRLLLEFFIPEFVRKELRLKIKTSQPPLQMIIRSDQKMLDIILSNLIKNALKFTNRGSIEIGYEVSNGAFNFYIKDTGIGISPEFLESVFDRFILFHGHLHPLYEGSGLGLAICKAYTKMLKGTIKVESEVDKGSVFSISIPVRLADEASSETIPSPDAFSPVGMPAPDGGN